MNTQPLLFSEPSIAETGVWCSLHEGIDPAEWAALCRQLGLLSPSGFEAAKQVLTACCTPPSATSSTKPKHTSPTHNPDSLKSRFRRLFTFDQNEAAHLPLVSLGPGKVASL